MQKIVVIQKIVKKNKKNITKITKKSRQNKHEIVTEIFLKKKMTKKGNMDKTDTKICLKKIKVLKEYGKMYHNAIKTLL